jgi:hypothetical protein
MNGLFENRKSYLAIVLGFINMMNIIFFALSVFGFALDRPLIIYDYFLLLFLIAFRAPVWSVWIGFVMLTLLDVMTQLSFTFQFGIVNMVKNLEFTLMFSFSWQHTVLAILGVVMFACAYFVIRKLKLHSAYISRTVLVCASTFIVIIAAFDLLNGDSMINRRKIAAISQFNLGGSALKNAILDIRNLESNTLPTPLSTPISFQTFLNDSSSNQLLVIVESWGLLASDSDQRLVNAHLSMQATRTGWNPSFGSSTFSGSTTNAELRELYGMNGDYRYFLDSTKARNFSSLLDKKKEQGYFTIGAHSFSGKMFNRDIWWKHAGADSVLFFDSPAFKDIDKRVNNQSPYRAFNDEFTYHCLSAAKAGKKKFGYLLTVNSHLPFHYDAQDDINRFNKALSSEAENQLSRILEFLSHIMTSEHSREWDTILLIGDHMPPFTKRSDRYAYSSTQVPYLILTKKK